MKYFTHKCFSFQHTSLSTCLTTKQYRLKQTVQTTLELVLTYFYSLLMIAPLVTKRYEEILAFMCFSSPKFKRRGDTEAKVYLFPKYFGLDSCHSPPSRHRPASRNFFRGYKRGNGWERQVKLAQMGLFIQSQEYLYFFHHGLQFYIYDDPKVILWTSLSISHSYYKATLTDTKNYKPFCSILKFHL
jgi:hypothetical protein